MRSELNIAIIDDESLAREKLCAMLSSFSNVNIAGEAEDVNGAIELINSKEPECVLLDIHLAGESGFDVLEGISSKTKIIFVTAYDKYAIRAFEVNAFDYLMKPVKKKRLKEALDKLHSTLTQKTFYKKPLEYEDHVFLPLESGSRFLKIKEIIYITAAAPYTEIVTVNRDKILVLKSLKEWESRLPKEHLVRIHRSTIININFVSLVEKWFNYAYRVHLKNIEVPLVISRRYASKLKGRL